MANPSRSAKGSHLKAGNSHDAIDLTDDRKAHAQRIDLTVSDDGSEDEDEDLKMALALSLQDECSFDTSVKKGQTDTSSHHNVLADTISNPSSMLTTTSEKPTSACSSLLSLDRKQMEAERLARLKRKREPTTHDRKISPPLLGRSIPAIAQQYKLTTKSGVRQDLDETTPTPAGVALKMAQSTSAIVLPHLQYPTGKVFLTSFHPKTELFTSLTDLLKPTESSAPLKSALLSTFIVDFDWLLPHFNTRTVSFVLVLHAQNESNKRLLQQDFANIPNVRLVFPHVGGVVNCMHSKLMLLFYEDTAKSHLYTRCRIVVPSANLVPWDWGVGGVMENTAFVIDLPLRGTGGQEKDERKTTFQISLVQMLRMMGTSTDVIEKLEHFDFSQTAAYGFIHTIGGSHVLDAVVPKANIRKFFTNKTENEAEEPPSTTVSQSPCRTGAVGLSDTLRSLGLDTTRHETSYPLKLDFITSSMGNLKEPFLQYLFLAACGHAPESLLRVNNSSGTNISRSATDIFLPDSTTLKRNIQIYFPSERTVRESKGGPSAAGTICFQSKWWSSLGDSFPKEMVSDCIGVRHDGMLMHSKMLFARFASPKSAYSADAPHHQNRRGPTGKRSSPKIGPATTNGPAASSVYAGWVYIGSANLSESAWGSLVLDSKTKRPKLNCRNWESGVVVPIPMKPEHEGKNLHDLSLQEVFGDFVPVPIEYPATKLIESGRQPWFFSG